MKLMLKADGVLLSLAVAGLVMAVGCASVPKPPPDASPEERLRYGYRLLERGTTYNAKQVFEELIYSAPGSAIIDSAHFGLAETFFAEDNYYQALVEYEIMVSSFPRSPLVDNAAFKIGICYWEQSPGYKLDQTETRRAIDAFQIFLLDYPGSELVGEAVDYLYRCRDKLARKLLYQGMTYSKLGTDSDMRAVVIYLQEMLQLYPDSSYTDEALWWLAGAFYHLQELDQAAVVYGALVQGYPDSKRIKAARERLTELGSRPGAASVPPPGP